jgi:hypothetical protein
MMWLPIRSKRAKIRQTETREWPHKRMVVLMRRDNLAIELAPRLCELLLLAELRR